MIDNRTANLNLPKPDAANNLQDDVGRLASALDSLDTAVFARQTQAQVNALITSAVNALLNGAPAALDTLKELADAINDDASFAASITTALSNHTSRTDNPHGVTAAQLGLGSVENKTAAQILAGLTSAMVTGALGYTPLSGITGAQVNAALGYTAADAAHVSAGAKPYSYANRANLRGLTPSDGDQAVVEDLGYFVFYAGSTEFDDDATCFTATGGCWLLQATSFGTVQALIDSAFTDAEIDASAADAVVAANAAAATAALKAALPTLLFGSGNPGITSVVALGNTSFNISVPGALPGDSVVLTPPASVSAAGSGYLTFHGVVEANDNVAVLVQNTNTAAAVNMPVGSFQACVIRAPS